MWSAAEPGRIDPHQETSIFPSQVFVPLYSGLLQWDDRDPASQKTIADLATDWSTSKDGLALTLKLRTGVKLHSGDTFTAEDAKFSIERIMNPPAGVVSPWKSLWDGVTAIEAPDPQTVTIKLKEPKPLLMQLLAWPYTAMVSKKQLQADPLAIVGQGNGTGPFRFKEWRKGVSIELARNPDYYEKGRPYMDGIKWLVVTDASTQFAAFRTGQLVMTGFGTRGLFVSELRTLQREMPDAQTWQYDCGCSGRLLLNVQKPPLDNKMVRQAILKVIDVQKVIDLAYQGVGRKGGFIAPGFWSLPEEELNRIYPPFRGPTNQDIEDAKKLLAQAGYPSGLTVSYVQATLAGYEEQQIASTSQMQKIGVKVNVRVQQWPGAMTAAVQRGDFDIVDWPTLGTIYDPDIYFSPFVSDSFQNYGKYKNPEVDRLFAQQSRELDPQKRKALVNQMERIVIDDAPAVQHVHRQYLHAARPAVKNYVGPGTLYSNLKWTNVWLDK